MRSALLVLALFAVGCDDTGAEFRPDITDAPSVADLGELPVIGMDEWGGDSFDVTTAGGVVYSRLGADPDPSVVGGATFEFAGTGGTVCVVMDPGNLFWNLGLSGEPQSYKYEDNYRDDGDLDLDVGLSAYYTGSPGISMGDFNAVYTDPLGVDHTLAFNECDQRGYLGDRVHAGRGAVEFCEIDTAERAGIMFTGALHTFTLPIDDSMLDYAVAVFEVDGSCGELTVSGSAGVTECTFPNEVNGGAEWAHSELEQKFCTGPNAVNNYCADHLEDEDAPCAEPSQATDPNR